MFGGIHKIWALQNFEKSTQQLSRDHRKPVKRVQVSDGQGGGQVRMTCIEPQKILAEQ